MKSFFIALLFCLSIPLKAQHNKLSLDINWGMGINQYPQTNLNIIGIQFTYWAESYELSSQLNYHLKSPNSSKWVFSAGIRVQKLSIPFVVKGMPYFIPGEGFPRIYVHSSSLDIYHQVSTKIYQTPKVEAVSFFEMAFSLNDPFNFSKKQYNGYKKATIGDNLYWHDMFYTIKNKTNQYGGKMGAGINLSLALTSKTMFLIRAGYYLGLRVMQMYNLRTQALTQDSVLVNFYMSSYGSGVQFSMGIRHYLTTKKRTKNE